MFQPVSHNSGNNGSPPDLVAIGYLTKPHGIRGELIFVPSTDSPGLAEGLLYLRPRAGGKTRTVTVASRRRHHGALLMRFAEVPDRTAAELLRSHTVLLPKDRLPPLDDDEIYLSDLPGLTVLAADAQHPDGRPLGVIASAEAPAGQILWTIKTPEGREILFPAVEDFVLSIEPERGIARIAPPPGLLELYLGE